MISSTHPAYPEDTGPLVYMGYWRWTDKRIKNDPRPTPHEHVDGAWDPAERASVVAYLRTGDTLHTWLGSSTCRFCGLRPNGNLCLTDGVYVWPEGLAHLVEAHGVRVPQQFVDHLNLGQTASP